jgi:hypothetical protein
MKKFFIAAIVALVCLGLALPAMAKVVVGGRITHDVFYFSQNSDRVRSQTTYSGGGVPTFPYPQPNPQSSFSVMEWKMPTALNRLNVAYSNDDNTIRGFIELRGGNSGDKIVSTGNYTGSALFAGSGVIWNYAWIDWVLGPNDYLRFGRQTQSFSIRAPDTFLGHTRGHIIGVNFGNLNGGASRDGVRWFHKFSDVVSLDVGLYDPSNDGGEAVMGFTPEVIGGATARVLEENVLPRIDIALPLNFGAFRLYPSVTYLKQSYDQVSAGREDTVDVWGGSLAARWAVGPLTFDAEVTYGQNLGNASYSGGGGTVPLGFSANALVAGNDSINDADVTAWWLDVGWKIGPATIHGIVGSMKIKRDDDPTSTVLASGIATGTNLDTNRWMYGISVPIAIAKGFTVRPEIMGYDWDTSATVGNASEVDFGKEYIVGVQFELIF